MYCSKALSTNYYVNIPFRLSDLEENKPVNYLCSRQDLHHKLKLLEQKVTKYCYYCHRCIHCIKLQTHQNALSRNSFYTHNKDIVYWDVQDLEFNAKNFVYEIKLVLKIEDCQDVFYIIYFHMFNIYCKQR